MQHPWIPSSTRNERKKALSKIGVNKELDLFNDIPPKIINEKTPFPSLLPPNPLTHWEIERLIGEITAGDARFHPSKVFTGGACPHYVHPLVEEITGRAEFYTSYTPYQPEIAQGLLQTFFEYQSMIADVFEMDVVNASHYDGAAALAEASLMAVRVTKKSKVAVATTLYDAYIDVLHTYLYGPNIRIEYLGTPERVLDEESKLQEYAAIIVGNPDHSGRIWSKRLLADVVSVAEEKGSLIIAVTEPISLGVIAPPGEYGAHIGVAEGRSLGVGLNYGGNGLGIIATQWDRRLVRQMPGRIIGLSEDVDGNTAFSMILQTREQHIRREKATSNITTNEALTTVAAAVYLALLGKTGLKRLGTVILRNTRIGHKLLSRQDYIEVDSKNHYFREVPAHIRGYGEPVYEALSAKGILGPTPARRLWWKTTSWFNALFCFNEFHIKEDVELLLKFLEEVTPR